MREGEPTDCGMTLDASKVSVNRSHAGLGETFLEILYYIRLTAERDEVGNQIETPPGYSG